MRFRVRPVHTVIASLGLALLMASSAFAWSNKEHIQLTRIAAERLIARPDVPPAMKEWLRANVGHLYSMDQEREYFMTKRIGIVPHDVEGLPFWATMPDMHALMDPPGKKVEPFGVDERLLHYIDVEYFCPDESKRTYSDDLSHKPTASDFPDNLKDWRYDRAGVLPFAVRHSYQKMVESIRAGRLNDEPGQYPRDDHAVKWAGLLAHYAEDNTQPQHATIDYKSAAYFADKRKAPNVHAEVEYRMCDDEDEDFMSLRKDFWPLFATALEKGADPVDTSDTWKATIEVSLASYDALPLIGRAAMAATREGGTPQKPEGPAQPFDTEAFFRFKGQYHGQEMTVLEMKAQQTAWAVHRVERLWLQAWAEAQKPATQPTTRPASQRARVP